MKAIVQDRFGPPDVLRLEDVDAPAVDADGVLVRVRAASVNPADWHAMRGSPWFARPMFGLLKPKQRTPGIDLAGIVEAVGENVTDLRPGDEIFGARNGSLAELVVGGKNFVQKPAALSFEQAGAIAIAGCTALQALRDKGRLEAGQRVLVNGAAGGVGTFAVQIAKAMGAHVTGVCSTRNVDLVRSLGADEVVDYTTDDFTGRGRRYDLVIDTVGNRSTADLRRALTPKGTVVLVGGDGKLHEMLAPLVVGRFVSQRLVSFIAKINKDDLAALGELTESGKLTPVIDRTYPLEEAAEAIRYLETGHVRGKVVVTME
jgi:NADPH:quinone reductase-like Zn-dependent oxidoreductase